MIATYPNRHLAAAIPALIDSARHSLAIAVYQLAPRTTTAHAAVAAIWRALEAAPKRCVHCRIVIHAGAENRNGAAAAMQAGKELKRIGWDVIVTDSGQIMHAKAAIIDGRRLLIGSHNWTASALCANRELSVLIDDTATADEAQAWFDNEWQRY